MHYYQHDLALVHDRGYGQYADRVDASLIPARLAGLGVEVTRFYPERAWCLPRLTRRVLT
jgi:hypothetical protein